MVDDRRVVYEASLETRKAERAAKAWEKRLEGLSKREKTLTEQEKALAKEMDRVRDRLLKLARAEATGAKDRKSYNRETKLARIELREQAEASRRLRQEQSQLQRQTSALRKEEERHRRAIDKSTRAAERYTAATRRARARSARAAGRTHDVHRAQGATGGRIEELQGSIAGLERRTTTRGRLAYGARERYRQFSSREGQREMAGRAVSGTPGFAARAVGVAAAGVGAVGGAIGGIAQVGAERETLKAGLSTALGSEKEAEKAFGMIKKFATETPFAVSEVTAAVTMLKTRGLEPTAEAATEALRIYGDVAGGMGQDLPTVINAVSAASLGEFEQLKTSFGVVGKKMGDDVALTFQGVTTTIKNDADAITGYLKDLSRENFAGGMAKQAATIGGAWSNVGDAISNFAEEIYQSELGEALKEVLADITGTVNSSDDLAKSIGENLADAVREGYAWFKKLLGPVDELPDKFEDAFQAGKTFVGVVGDLIAAGAKLADTLGASGVAMTAFVAAAASAMGPLGAIAAASAAAGYALTTMLIDSETHLGRLQDRVKDIRRDARTAAMQEQADALQGDVDAGDERFNYGKQVSAKLVAARLREKGVSSVSELSSEDQVKLARAQLKAERTAPGERARFEDAITRSEERADKAEFARLRAIPKKDRKPSEQKRLSALAGALDVKLPTGGKGKKPKLSAAESEQASAIESAAKTAGLRAADKARLEGRGGEALAEGAREEKETRERLKAQASRGEALPGQIDTAFARIAGYGDVSAAPPPPIMVTNYQFKVDVAMPVEGSFSGTPQEFSEAATGYIQDVLETSVFPEAALALRSEINR